jgi:hypothetical protein
MIRTFVYGLAKIDHGKDQPRDEDTEGGTQSADKSLINRSSQCSIPGPVQAIPRNNSGRRSSVIWQWVTVACPLTTDIRASRVRKKCAASHRQQ